MAFYNLARMYTETTGTGTVTLTTAVPGCLTFDLAGVANGATVEYAIITYDLSTHRPTHTEVGSGTYTASGTTLARTTVEKSTNSNNKITLTGLSEVFLAPLASDFNGFGGGPGGGVQFAIYENASIPVDTISSGGGDVVPLTFGTEVIDDNNLISTDVDDYWVADVSGWYDIQIQLYIVDGSNFLNGSLNAYIDTNATVPTNAPNLFILTATDSAKTEIQMTWGGPLGLNVGEWFAVGLVNNTAHNVQAAVVTAVFTRLGDL